MKFTCETRGCDDVFVALSICPSDARCDARSAGWTVDHGGAGHGWLAACPVHPLPLPGDVNVQVRERAAA